MIPFWMRMSFILLLTAGKEGRIYNGRKKPPALTAQRMRSGPHVCFSGMGNGCCPGWTVSPGSGLCLQPLCAYGCGSGFCVAPNVCSCRDGHQGITCTDHYASEHERELEDKGYSLTCLSAMCEQGCKVINGATVCSCYHGYTLGKDGKSCYDIDECSRPQASSLCQQQCKNIIGSYRCLCYYGYQISPNGRSCVPIKHPNTIAASVPCGEYGCELSCNDGGCEHISRVCPIGFRMTETANGVACTDINECVTSSCKGTCLNTEGGYMCDCGPGFKLAADRSTCLDIDECSAHRSVCQHRCKNIHGSYRCLCGAGFTLQSNGRTCTDINECRRPGTSHLCQHFCHNTQGSFFCSCRTGFALSADRMTCVDVNECVANTTLCSSGSCINTLGSYICSCPAGFLSINGGCSAISIEVQTVGFLQAVHNLPEIRPTSPTAVSHGAPPTTAMVTMVSSTIVGEMFTTMSTSKPQAAPTNVDPVPPPQHLKMGHSPLAQKSSGISHMPLKESILFPTGAPTTLHTNLHCWHNKELRQTGSSWTEAECMDCTCQEGTISCERRICSPNCSHPVLHPDRCCPTCDGCFFEGTLRADGELFPTFPDNCTICICLAGNITCIPPVCPPVSCFEPFMSDCCLRCPDGCEVQGKLYPHGARFSRDENGCTSCVCQNGAVECSFVPCPSLECPREDWVLEAGQCCFKCQEPPQSTGCPFDDNGLEIPIGQIWSPGDPCSICICQADGSIVCKKTDCVETCPHPIMVPGQCCPDCSAGCSYGRKTYKNNESFPSNSDPCLTCICLMGTVACSPIECALNCTYPFHDEGECCPVCRDCTYDGRKVLNRQTFSLESEPCTQCTCQDGEVQCEAISCSVSCSHPYTFPGECCATCEECAFEEHVLENGGSYTLKSDPCVVCHCFAGNVHCEEREGSCTPCEQNTQDCLNEVPGSFHIKQLHHSQHDTIIQKENVPIKLLSITDQPLPIRLSLNLKLLSVRNPMTVITSSDHPSFVSQTEVPRPHSFYNAKVTDIDKASQNLESASALQSELKTEVGPGIEVVSVSHSDTMKTGYVSTSAVVPTQPVAFSGTSFKPSPSTSHSTSNIHEQVVSYSDLSPNGLSQESSGSSFLLPPSPSSFQQMVQVSKPTPTLATFSRALVREEKIHGSSHTLGRPSSLVDNTEMTSVTSKPPYAFPSSPSGHQHWTNNTKLMLTDSEETKIPFYEAEQPRDCSLNGRMFTNGSIYIVDLDYCLHCECLKEEIYCNTPTSLSNGLCCQGCDSFPVDSCSKETNQIQKEQGEGFEFCRCQGVALQCRSCSSRHGCSREGTSQSSESEFRNIYIAKCPLQSTANSS
ncbi:von Willebrand factor C and EGF domain-containing protein isoform X2 [Hyla sarda]|uniref:von Willebrand factor C and EGF domain-containing protein isoform X2 n=1 Tax=Hyla sarda TaxID=327740 RepID=UPI0024C2C53E|nr:von Willebrand factor C and EGF domain-containing protein isoform X2 [Hyla sarda]